MGHVLMRLWWGSRDRLELPDRKASSNMPPPPGPWALSEGGGVQRPEVANMETREGGRLEPWVHRDPRQHPFRESFLPAFYPDPLHLNGSRKSHKTPEQGKETIIKASNK